MILVINWWRGSVFCITCVYWFSGCFGFSYLHALGGHILISAAYIPILAFVYYLKDHIQRLANKEDGKVITDKDLMWKKEIVYWMRIYLFLY